MWPFRSGSPANHSGNPGAITSKYNNHLSFPTSTSTKSAHGWNLTPVAHDYSGAASKRGDWPVPSTLFISNVFWAVNIRIGFVQMKKAIALATASLSNFEDPSQRRVLNNLQGYSPARKSLLSHSSRVSSQSLASPFPLSLCTSHPVKVFFNPEVVLQPSRLHPLPCYQPPGRFAPSWVVQCHPCVILTQRFSLWHVHNTERIFCW